MATKKKKYQDVSENLEIDDYIFEGHVSEVIIRLQDLCSQYGKHHHLYLDLDAGHNNIEVSLRGTRSETDKERDKRLADRRGVKAHFAQKQQQADEAEKQEFFRLHEKFGHLL